MLKNPCGQFFFSSLRSGLPRHTGRAIACHVLTRAAAEGDHAQPEHNQRGTGHLHPAETKHTELLVILQYFITVDHFLNSECMYSSAHPRIL